MSLYADYIKERENKETVESELGFATYSFIKDGAYIVDIYVKPEYRKSHVASDLANQVTEIAKKKGLKKLFGSVVPSANGSTASLKALFSYGFKLVNSANDFIWLEKEI